ncbi:TPA: hypothetical protein N0F65_003707 [Lagenidium giganteum]|uniref:HTH CENPB-type domain-containing protein n=1 Tax=Lagenidium giganteum TaxID=4803 RepID=A0AAV2YYF3_9STRA|nr:TPA: hypothetical protein N0F65_003707 [Lagenidium giganteum]
MPPGRTNVKGNASKEKKFARQPYTNAFKVAVIEHFRQNKSIASTMDKFFLTVSHSKLESKKQMVRKWVRSALAPSWHRATNCESVKDLRTEGIPVTRLMLQLQAQQVAQDAGMPENAFKGSRPWIKRFLRQHKLSLRGRTRAGKTTIAQAEAAQTEFVNRIQTFIVKHRITRIFNADQTGINHEYLPKRTINTTGEKTVWIKCFAAAKLIPREPCENVYEAALEHETTRVVLAMEKLGLTDPQMPVISDDHDIDSLECDDDDDDEACESDE